MLTSAADATVAPQNVMNVMERRSGRSFFAFAVEFSLPLDG